MKTDFSVLQRYLASNISELQRTIQIADTKANIVIVLIGVVLSLFFNFFISKNLIPIWQVMIVLVMFFISGIFAFTTLYPRAMKGSGKFSLIYYKDIINLDIKKIARDLSNKNFDQEIVEDYLNSLRAVSIIVDKKIMKLRLSYIFLFLAITIKIIFESFVWLNLT